MSKKRKDRLMLNILEDKRHKHRVAMVNEESGWNQHEPNSGMARMFVIMLLIHVVVIGGIIVYDFVNGEEATTTALTSDHDYSTSANALPPSGVSPAALEKEMPIDEYSTYEWRSGDSLPSVAQKLGVTEETLIKLNMLDKGAQIDQHTIIRFPKQPVVKAVALNVTPTRGGAAKITVVADAPPAKAAAEEKDGPPMNLTPPGETFTFEPTLLDRLTPEPTIAPGRVVQDSPPAAKPIKDDLPAAAKVVVKNTPPAPAKIQDKPPEKLAEVPKAVPMPRPVLMASNDTMRSRETERPKPVTKRIIDSPPASKPVAAPKSAKGSYVVKPGDTLYRIAARNGVSVAALQKANSVVKPEALRDGMKLVIPVK